MVDIVVVGGGPAGCRAAELLAGRGFDVHVFEEHPGIGEPVDCSGVIGAEAFVTAGLPNHLKLGEIHPLTLISPSALKIHFSPPSPLAYILDRAGLDRFVADRARMAGAVFHLGSRVVDLGLRDHCVEVAIIRQTSNVKRQSGEEGTNYDLRLTNNERRSRVEARVVILAGGPRYKLQRRLGMGVPANFLKTAQTEAAIRDIGETTVLLGSRVAPKSFAWIVPYRRGEAAFARVGVSAKTSPTPYLKHFLQRLYDDGHLDAPNAPIRSWVIPASPLPKSYAERVLAIGDAAGQNKPTTGGGIFYGLLSAEAAARTISTAFRKGDFSEGVMRRYEQEWRRTLGREIKIGAFFRKLVERLTDDDIDSLFRVVQSDGILKAVAKSARFDWHRDVISFALRHPDLGRIFLRGLFR